MVVRSIIWIWLFATPWTAAFWLPCPSLSPRVCSNSYPLSQWCHPTILSSVAPFSSCSQIFPSIRVFSSELALPIRWPKYWSFRFIIKSLNEYSGLISFRIDRFDLLVVQGTLSRVFSNATIRKHLYFSAYLSLGPTLTSIHGSWKNYSFDYMDLSAK